MKTPLQTLKEKVQAKIKALPQNMNENNTGMYLAYQIIEDEIDKLLRSERKMAKDVFRSGNKAQRMLGYPDVLEKDFNEYFKRTFNTGKP